MRRGRRRGGLGAHETLRAHERPVVLGAYLTLAVRNRAIDVLRPPATAPLPEQRATEDAVVPVLRREALRQVVGGVRALPPRQRAVLVGHALDGRPHEALAADLGISVPAAKALLHRARERLRAAA